MSKNNLSPKQRSFINAYLQTGNATEAAMQVYNTGKRSVAAQIGYENLRKPDIKQAIEVHFVCEGLSPVYIADMMKNVLDHGTITQKLEICRIYFKMHGLS
ncbi:MAG: terminase small subunit [Candidatus Daviesbacteria bacterium]|nr:terminase small subunit [Candidatus Daviesbacteria bacterium]